MYNINSVLIRIKGIIQDKRGRIKTLGNMAKKIGIEESAFSRKLKTTSGRKDDLTLKEFLKIAEVLKIDPAVLLNPDYDISEKDTFKEMLKPIIKEILKEIKNKGG